MDKHDYIIIISIIVIIYLMYKKFVITPNKQIKKNVTFDENKNVIINKDKYYNSNKIDNKNKMEDVFELSVKEYDERYGKYKYNKEGVRNGYINDYIDEEEVIQNTKPHSELLKMTEPSNDYSNYLQNKINVIDEGLDKFTKNAIHTSKKQRFDKILKNNSINRDVNTDYLQSISEASGRRDWWDEA